MAGEGLDFEEIFSAYVENTKRDWGTSRDSSVGASEVFDCERKVWFTKKGNAAGYTPDEGDINWGAATRGNIMEAHYIVPAITEHLPDGATLLFAGTEQESLRVGFNSATPDGLIVGLKRDALKKYGVEDLGSDDACVVVEFKTVDPRVSLRDARSKNVAQAQVQLGMFRELTQYKPNYCIVLYVDASFFDKITVFVFEHDENVWKIAKTRADHIFKSEDPKDMVPEGMIDSKSCEHCLWTTECMTIILGKIPEKSKAKTLPPEYEEILCDLINKWYDTDREAKEITATAGGYRQQIKDLLAETNFQSVKTPVGGVTWFKQAGRKSVNTKAMAEAGIDLTPFEKVGEPFDVLRIMPD